MCVDSLSILVREGEWALRDSQAETRTKSIPFTSGYCVCVSVLVCECVCVCACVGECVCVCLLGEV